MAQRKNDDSLVSMADEIFELVKIASAVRTRAKGEQSEELTEAEFLAIDVLIHGQPMTVGEIQKRIGVLPAQMSRLIRSLESKRDGAFVSCSINPGDRRKIDVAVTDEGRNAYDAYRELRTRFARLILSDLGTEERESFMGILRHIKDVLQTRTALPE